MIASIPSTLNWISGKAMKGGSPHCRVPLEECARCSNSESKNIIASHIHQEDILNVSQYYEILGEKSIGALRAKVAQINLPKLPQKKRSEVLFAILEESGASAMIESWKRGSILHKPRTTFKVTLIYGDTSA